MKSAKRAAALALCAALTFSLAACGNEGKGGDSGSTPPTAAEAVKAAMEKMSAAKSMDAQMTIEMEMAIGDQSFTTATTMDMTTFNDPMKLRADVAMSMGELGAMDLAVYAQQDGDSYVLYVFDGTNWASQGVNEADLAQYSAQGSMDLYTGGVTDFAADGTEELAGGTAERYIGVIRGGDLEAVLKASGAMASFESAFGGDAEALMNLYTGLGDLNVTIWVDQATGYPVRYYMDMTGVMAEVMEKLTAAVGGEGDAGISVPKMALTMECSNFDAATNFTIPDEALRAD